MPEKLFASLLYFKDFFLSQKPQEILLWQKNCLILIEIKPKEKNLPDSLTGQYGQRLPSLY